MTEIKFEKIIIMIPKLFRVEFQSMCYEHKMEKVFNYPNMILKLYNDDYYIKVDRKCPQNCDCEIESFKIHKNELNDFLRNQKKWIKVFDINL